MYPFDRLVDNLNLKRDTSRRALFDIILVLQNTENTLKTLDLSEMDVDGIDDIGYRISKFDIDIIFKEYEKLYFLSSNL